MLQEWAEALICPIHKKGSKHKRKISRGISLLNIGYKVLATALVKKLTALAENLIGDYQYGFRAGGSTID